MRLMSSVVPLGSAAARTFRILFLHMFVLLICAGSLPAAAQVLPQVAVPSAGPVMGLRQQGLYVTAPVTVDGQPVFRVSALATGASLPIDTRVLMIQNAIGQTLALDPDRHTTAYDPKSFTISIHREGSQYALEATDDRHDTPLAMVTVTSNDANAFGVSDHDLAAQWQQSLQSAIRTALEKRQPQNIRSNLLRVGRIASILIAVSLLLLAVLVVMRRRIRTLKRQADERQQSMQSNLEEASGHSGDEAEHSRRRALALGMRAAQPEQRIARLSALSGIVIWLIVALWVGGITWSLLLFPQTTAVGQFIMSALGRILAVWLVAGIVDRLLQLAIVHFADLYAHHGTTSEERARHALRAPT
ncbi:MAG TPA: hypothetical protein VFN49_09410, partial [Candidatus Aquilonibacter sp.]|nr:hypothetical protein [Candidatus Aquilonibacter sp.]